MVISRSHVGPASARQCSEYSNASSDGRQVAVWSAGQEVPQGHQDESRAGCDGNEDHENGALGVTVADGGGDGGEPLLGVAVPLILDDLGVVERDADDEGAEEGGCRETRETLAGGSILGGAFRRKSARNNWAGRCSYRMPGQCATS